jgi:hypothetical protein
MSEDTGREYLEFLRWRDARLQALERGADPAAVELQARGQALVTAAPPASPLPPAQSKPLEQKPHETVITLGAAEPKPVPALEAVEMARRPPLLVELGRGHSKISESALLLDDEASKDARFLRMSEGRAGEPVSFAWRNVTLKVLVCPAVCAPH